MFRLSVPFLFLFPFPFPFLFLFQGTDQGRRPTAT